MLRVQACTLPGRQWTLGNFWLLNMEQSHQEEPDGWMITTVLHQCPVICVIQLGTVNIYIVKSALLYLICVIALWCVKLVSYHWKIRKFLLLWEHTEIEKSGSEITLQCIAEPWLEPETSSFKIYIVATVPFFPSRRGWPLRFHGPIATASLSAGPWVFHLPRTLASLPFRAMT